MFEEKDLVISEQSYQWTLRALRTLHKRLGIDIRLHDPDDMAEKGQIFLFNHFARFETFIPQWMIYEKTGAACRSVASQEFFTEDDTFARYLLSVGAVPNRTPDILAFLAKEILRGRKVVIFPEGGMVKDRRVIDHSGGFSIYSRSAKERRKHHTGAAVLAQTLELFKERVRRAHLGRARGTLEEWAEGIGLPDCESLIEAARKPTLVIPSNITFMPIRIGDNLLKRGAEMLAGGLKGKYVEELLIEGNLLLKPTDMDIRFGRPIDPRSCWAGWERWVRDRLAGDVQSLEDLFAIGAEGQTLRHRLAARGMRIKAFGLRDAYMKGMYEGVTVNLSHVASRLILGWVEQGRETVEHDHFHRALYLAVRNLLEEPDVHLHDSLLEPATRIRVSEGEGENLAQFLRTCVTSGLLEYRVHCYRFLPKLLDEPHFDEVRIENVVSVYANEGAPIPGLRRAVDHALKESEAIAPRLLARMLFDDEVAARSWSATHFSAPRHAEINDAQSATADPAPYLLLSEDVGASSPITPPAAACGPVIPLEGGEPHPIAATVPRRPLAGLITSPRATSRAEGLKPLGVVLVHGFLASPAEVRPMADELAARGLPVLGVRLAGHGTSPWDLEGRPWDDWLDSVRRGVRIMRAFAERVCLVGFSSGGALCLHQAARHPAGLAGVVSVAAPIKFKNRNLVFVPLVHGANRLARGLGGKGLLRFIDNEPEHPDINYRHIPVSALNELKRMTDRLQRRLGEVHCPALVIQGDRDPVVDAKSAQIIFDGITSVDKRLEWVASERHGILYEDIGGTRKMVADFVEGLLDRAPPALAGEPSNDDLLEGRSSPA